MIKDFWGYEPQNFEERGCAFTAQEIAQQPRLWRELACSLRAKRQQIEAFMDAVTAHENLRIILTGAGSSAFAGEALSLAAARACGIRAEAVHTTDIVSAYDSVLFKDLPTLIISFARSGNSPESVGALEHVRKYVTETFELALCCAADSKLAEFAATAKEGLLLTMPQGSCDKGFAMTSSETCMLLAGYAVLNYKNLDAVCRDIDRLADRMEKSAPGFATAAKEFAEQDFKRIIFLGSGAFKGIARECAVKILELTTGIVNSGFDSAMGFRHGPKSVINDETVTVHFISNNEYTAQYDIDLAKEIARERKLNQMIVVKADNAAEVPAQLTVKYNTEGYEASAEICSVVQSLVFVQMLAVFKSLALNIATDNPCVGGGVNRVVQGVVVYGI